MSEKIEDLKLDKILLLEFELKLNEVISYFARILGPEQLITMASTLVRMTIKTGIISINPMTDDIDILKNNRSIIKENILEIHSKIFDQIYDETCELAIKSYVNAKKKHESDQD